jgi:hypothetical protein
VPSNRASEWPPDDVAAIYEVPRERATPETPIEQRAQLAAERVRDGMPVSDALLDAVLAELERDPSLGSMTETEYAEYYASTERAGAAREVLEAFGDVFGDLSHDRRDGRDVVRVRVTAKLEDVRAALVERLGAEFVVVERAAITEAEGDALTDRVFEQRDALKAEGVFVTGGSHDADGAQITYFAADQARAEALLRERFGDAIHPRYQGAGLHRFRPFPFASWHADGKRLHVFYALPLNGERPGGCLAHETDDSVTVALLIRDWRGWKTLVGGFTPAHATVALTRPLDGRVVIDDSVNQARPHWTVVAD